MPAASKPHAQVGWQAQGESTGDFPNEVDGGCNQCVTYFWVRVIRNRHQRGRRFCGKPLIGVSPIPTSGGSTRRPA